MFRNLIGETPFTSRVAESEFAYIKSDRWNGDVSFLSTLRAMMCDNKINGVEINVRISSIAEGDLYKASYSPNVISIVDVCGEKSIFDGIVSDAQEHLGKKTEKITLFYKSSFDTACFSNEAMNSVVVFVRNLTAAKMHYLQVSIPVMLPWVFNKENGLTDNQRNLLMSLAQKTDQTYIECLNKIAKESGLTEKTIRLLINDAQQSTRRFMMDQLESEISFKKDKITSLSRSIADTISSLHQSEEKLFGLTILRDQDQDDYAFADYILSNKNLSDLSVEANSVKFTVKAYLDFFDNDAADSVIKNKGSYVYRFDGKEEMMGALMRELFVADSPRMRIKTCARYVLDFNHGISTVRGYGFAPDCALYMPNPHIDTYGCMGDYANIIAEMLKLGNYIGAVEQCVASCQSLNLMDLPVMDSFCKDLALRDPRCIELDDGTVMTPTEAFEWIKEQSEKGGDKK